MSTNPSENRKVKINKKWIQEHKNISPKFYNNSYNSNNVKSFKKEYSKIYYQKVQQLLDFLEMINNMLNLM
jgi:hypothetical protein